MAMEKQKKLVDTLLSRTLRGELEWRTAPRRNTFQADLQRSSVLVGSSAGDTDEYAISLVNSAGVVVDTFNDVELSTTENTLASLTSPMITSTNIFEEPPLTWHEKMRRLYHAARRNALGSEQVLDEILGELNERS